DARRRYPRRRRGSARRRGEGRSWPGFESIRVARAPSRAGGGRARSLRKGDPVILAVVEPDRHEVAARDVVDDGDLGHRAVQLLLVQGGSSFAPSAVRDVGRTEGAQVAMQAPLEEADELMSERLGV